MLDRSIPALDARKTYTCSDLAKGNASVAPFWPAGDAGRDGPQSSHVKNGGTNLKNNLSRKLSFRAEVWPSVRLGPPVPNG